MKGRGKAFFIILAIFSALFFISFISDVSQAAITPECPTGYTYNSSTKVCQADPICQNGSYDSTANYCTASATCSSGYFFNSSSSSYPCEMDPICPDGSYDTEKNGCVANATYTCSSGYSFNSFSYICEMDPTCPNGSFNATENRCLASADFTYDSNGNIIGINCPTGYLYWTTKKICYRSPECSDGGTFDGITDKCRKSVAITCPSGYSYNWNSHMCFRGAQCPGGSFSGGTTDKCINAAICPSGYSYQSYYHRCYRSAQCPAGGGFNGTTDQCQANPYPITPVNPSDVNNTSCVGKPVSISSGAVYVTETDFTINGIMPISLTRYHNSKAAQSRAFPTGFNGYTWSSNFDSRLMTYIDGYRITDPDGSITYYLDINGDGIYEADFPRGETSKLIKNTNGTFKRIYKDGSSEEFNVSGYLTAVVDKNGNRLTLTRQSSNGSGNLLKITDSAGREVNITYTTYGPSTITFPDGNAINYTYVSGNLQKVTYPDGTYKTYEYITYNSVGLLTGIKNEKGNYIEKHTYDSQGRGITSSADGTNDLLTINYTNDTQTTVTDSLGRQTTYTYDKSKGKGHLISRTGPGCQSCGQGNVAYTYDDKLNVTSETDALGNVTAYTYDANGNTLTKTEASGTSLQRTTTYTYNSLNDLIEQTDPMGTKTQYQYDTKRNLIKIQTLNPNLEILTQAAFTRNTKGQIIKLQILNPNSEILTETNIAYDTYGNIQTITDALNHTTTYTYDIMGKPLTATDANGKTTTLTYDQRARLISTKDSLNNITAYTYDQAGSLITLTDAKANATTFQYDLIGRLTQQTDPMAKQTIYTYDSQGNLISKTDPLTNTIQYTYDALNRLVQKTYPDASTTTYQFDAIGNLTGASNAYISYSFAYDALGRMTSVTDSLGKTISYVYDANSNRTSMTSPIGTTSYVYNALNQLTQLVQGTQTFGFTYDSLGRRTMLTLPNATKTNYTYDNLSRLLTLTHLNPTNQPFETFTYTYDNVGNKLTKQDTTGTHNYTYDNTYQLTQATHPSIPTEAFAYDQVGNRTNTTVDAANKLLQDPNASYQYDANGNRYIKTQSDGSIVYYSYDYEGRLTRVETQKPGLTTIAVYRYDALGRRFEKNVDGVVTRYLYSNEGLIAEYDINNNLKKSYGWMPNGIWGTDPLYMTENNQTYIYHNDGLGTPQKMTDASGAVVWSAAYTSFGEATIDPSSTITSNLRFAGQYFDSETGVNYNLFRVYDPKTGTYITKDPIGFNAGDVNLYRYVFNNPANLIDPLGLETEVGFREFYPIPVPYALHCFIRFNKNDKDTLSFDKKGVHPDPNPSGALYSPTIGEENDECVKKEMKKCKAEDYDFTDFNCCHCASTALNACGLTNKGLWPNFPYDASNPPYKPKPKKPKSKKK